MVTLEGPARYVPETIRAVQGAPIGRTLAMAAGTIQCPGTCVFRVKREPQQDQHKQKRLYKKLRCYRMKPDTQVPRGYALY